MTSRRKQRRDKRGNDRLRDEALAAAAVGRFDRARTLLERALAGAPHNAGYWRALADVERRCGHGPAAERALRRALVVAPDYAQAAAELAELLAGRGVLREAVALLAEAAPHLEQRTAAEARLAEWRAQLPEAGDAPGAVEPAPVEPDVGRTARYDWGALADALLDTGLAPLPALLDAAEVEAGLGGDALREALLAEVYWRAAPIADRWYARLDEVGPHGRDLAGQRWRVFQGGGVLAPPEVVRVPPEREARPFVATRAFPFELLVALGPGDLELVLAGGTRRRLRERRLALAPGDGALVAPHARLVRVGGVWGLQARLRVLRAGERASAALHAPLG